jgi:hypothetical protein
MPQMYNFDLCLNGQSQEINATLLVVDLLLRYLSWKFWIATYDY